MSITSSPPAQPRFAAASSVAPGAMAAILWGTNFEATRIALLDMLPMTAAALRFAIASIAIMGWLALRGGVNLAIFWRNCRAFIALGAIGIAGFNAALFLGMQSASPITAALIMGTSPLTTALLDAGFQRRRPPARALTGMTISLGGVALTIGAFSGAPFAPGDLLILAGSLAWAIYTIGCRRWVTGAAPIETAAWTMLTGATALIALALALESPVTALATASGASWAALIWMALAGSVLAYIFWQSGIARLGPARASIMFNLVPISALIVAALFGRIPGWSQVAGVGVTIAGILLANSSPRPR